MASDSNSLPVAHSWKEEPCHFTWNLSAGVLTDFEKVIRNIDNDLRMTPDLFRVDQLLFRAYLEVSDSRLRWNVSKARTFLDEADDYIENHTETELQPGYRRVALLNRLWIEQRSHRTEEVKQLLFKLKGLSWCETDKLVVNTLLASALTRLGPTMITRSLQIYEEALKHFPDNTGFLYGALLMTGRQMRFQRRIGSTYEKMDEDGKKLMDQEKEYCEKLMDGEDEYQYGKSYLGLNLSRRKEQRHEASNLLEEAHKKAPDVEAVFSNLVRFYRNDKDCLGKAIHKLEAVLYQQPSKSNHDVPESHHQLALCYIEASKCTDNSEEKDSYQTKALEELDTCLRVDPTHIVASLKKAETLESQNYSEATQLFEEMFQKLEHYPALNKLDIYKNVAYFREKKGNISESFEMWEKVMELVSSFEYLDKKSCKWEIKGEKASDARKTAFGKLNTHYQGKKNETLLLGILHFQNLDFEEAVEKLSGLDPTTNLDIPCYLAEAYLKWGREQEMSNEPTAVRNCYKKARQIVFDARKQGLNFIRCRTLLSDTALANAHFNIETNTSQNSPSQSLVESDCIKSYREAVRCGSLVASLEVLRLIEKGFLKKTPRSKILQILAEIDVCCSQRPSDCLHRKVKPRTFEKGLNSRDTDIDTFALDCKKIKRDISTMLRKEPFFRQAWVQHFAMEKRVLEERFQNNEGELELDGREESSTKSVSIEETYAAIDCCEKLRPLLDHIILKFQKEELCVKEERKDQQFPQFLSETDFEKMKKVLRNKFQSCFKIDFAEHYPDLFENLAKVQPGNNSQNGFLETLCNLVNRVKHRDIEPEEIWKIVQDPVELARKCTDTVEEICNFFFDAMKESSDLREKVAKLVTDLKAEDLWRILTSRADFILRTGTSELLKVLAVIRQSNVRYVNKMAEGTWDLSKNLRKSHLELEVSLLQAADPSANEVLEKCRDTCKKADILLKEVMKKKRKGPQDDKDVEFPFRDKHPGSDKSSWEETVKKLIKRYLTEKRIDPAKLLKVILKAQPCSNEENYNFLLMQEFLKKWSSGVIPSAVSIKKDNGELRSILAVELTRWCTNNAEKIASQVMFIP